MQHTQRIKELDGLRGIAAIGVVLYHYFTRYDQLFGHKNLSTHWAVYGQYSVQLFFVISGFVIFWSLKNITKPLDFVISRFARLYPIYWIAVIITFLIVSLLGLPGRTVSISSFIGNFLMFHRYFDIPDVDGSYWTLKVELTFYAWMFIIYSLNMLSRIDFIICFLLILANLIHFNIIHLPEIIQELLFIKWSPFFCIGICLFKIHSNTFNYLTIFNLIFSLIITAFTFTLKISFLYFFFAVLLYLTVNGKMKFLKTNFFLFFGSISYSLYLLHQYLGYAIIRKGYEYNLPPIISIIISLLFVIIISYLGNIYIEKPSVRIIKEAYKKRNNLIKSIK